MGIISIVVWALIITLFFNYFASMAGKANTTEVMYGQFQQMVAEDKVYYVEYTSGKYTFYLKDDVAKVGLDPTKELDPTTATKQQVTEFNNKLKKAKSYYCAPVADPVDTMEMLNAHGVHLYGTPYVAELSPIISLLISYVLPMAIIMVLFFFLFRSMAGKMGGGLGGVGKANAKV